MGRRPQVQANIQVNGQSSEIQEKIDSISTLILTKLQSKIGEKIDQLDLEDINGLLKKLNSLLHAIKKPASSLQMVQIPMRQQQSSQTVAGSQRRSLNLQDADTKKRMRAAQKAYLDAESA